jgi:hypothetical protein
MTDELPVYYVPILNRRRFSRPPYPGRALESIGRRPTNADAYADMWHRVAQSTRYVVNVEGTYWVAPEAAERLRALRWILYDRVMRGEEIIRVDADSVTTALGVYYPYRR